jgi:hypothetical protein
MVCLKLDVIVCCYLEDNGQFFFFFFGNVGLLFLFLFFLFLFLMCSFAYLRQIIHCLHLLSSFPRSCRDCHYFHQDGLGMSMLS